MPLVDDVTAPIDPEDVDETYDSAPDGGLKPRFDVPWYVYLAAGRNGAHAAGGYGLKIPWWKTVLAGAANEARALEPVHGRTDADIYTAKGVLTPETVGTHAFVVGNRSYNKFTMTDNQSGGLSELLMETYRNTGSQNSMPVGPTFPERGSAFYRVPRAGGVDQTLIVGASENPWVDSGGSGFTRVVGQQGVGLSAYLRSRVKSYGGVAYGRADGLYFELAVNHTEVANVWTTEFLEWRLIAVTDVNDISGVEVLGSSVKNLPTKVGERRAMTLRCKDGEAVCFVDGEEVLRAAIPGSLLRNDYTDPGAGEGWFHAGAGNMYVGPHHYVQAAGFVAQPETNYVGSMRWYADLYVAHKSGHMGTVWSSFPNAKPFPPTQAQDQSATNVPPSRLGQPPVSLTRVPEGGAMGSMSNMASGPASYNSASWWHWSPNLTVGSAFGAEMHTAFNVNTADGVLLATLMAEATAPENDDLPTAGLVVRGNQKAKTFLLVEVFNTGGVVSEGTIQPLIKLWKYQSDGTRVLLKAGSPSAYKTLDYTDPTMTDTYKSVMGTGGTYHGAQVYVKTVGSSIKVYVTPASDYDYLQRPVLALQHTLSTGDMDTFGTTGTMVGFSDVAFPQTPRTAGPPMALAFVTKDPVDIVPDPPQVVEPGTDEPTDVGDGDDTQVDVPLPPGGGTTVTNGGDDKDGDGNPDTGSEVTTDRDDDGKVKTIITIKDPDGTTTVIVVPDYVDADPGNPLWFRVQWINGKIVIWFGGSIWFTYVLTQDDLSKLGTSRKYISFWSGGVRVVPPAGTTIIRGQWTPTALTMMVVVPTRMVAMGSAKDRLWGRVHGFSRPQVLIVGADDSVVLTDEPDDELLAAATRVFGGGRATDNIVSADVANLIGAAGYGDLLKEIAT